MEKTDVEVRPSTRWDPIGLVLLVLAVEAVLLVLIDARWAAKAKSHHTAPLFLFSWIAPNFMPGEGRFIGLAKTLALPGAAAGLPVLLGAWMFAARRRLAAGAAKLRPHLAVAAVLLVLGLIGDGVLYSKLAANPKNASGAERTSSREGDGPAPATAASPESNPGSTPTPAAPKVELVEKILFSSDRSGQQHIWMMNPDGTDQVQVSKTDRLHVEPRLAPDGTRVAFSSMTPDKKQVSCILDLVTGEEKEVCEGVQATFTGDGKGLLLRRDDKIYIHELAGGEERLVSPPMWSRCSYPSSSPDAKNVAMAVRPMAGYNIYILPLLGGEPRELVSGEGTCDPRWSPTGAQLSYQTESHIFTIKPDGKDKLQVTFGGGVQHYACWSPDEKRIAYCQGPGRDGPWQICTVSLVADEDPVVLTKEGSNIYPEWGRVPAAMKRPSQ